MYDAFPDNNVKNEPYDVLFGGREFTSVVIQFTGTFSAGLKQRDGT